MISVFFEYDFLRYSLYTSLIIGFLAPFVGVFLVVRRLSMMADALSHITLTGIAFSLLLGRYSAFFAGLNPVYMGIIFSASGSILIERLRQVYKFYKELAIPIILSSSIGVGVVLISLADGFNNDLFNYLFGSVAAVNENDFKIILTLTITVAFLFILFFKEWFFLSFDEEQAVISGIKKGPLHLIFMLIVAVVIGLSMQIVGILLVSALMTLPVAAAMRWARGFKQLFFYSVLFGESSVLIGIIAAFHLDLAPGGTIVMINVSILILSLLFTRRRK